MIIRGKPCCVYDVEIFSNVFHAVLYNTEAKQTYKFEVSERRNQMQEFCEMFLNEDLCFVGYNNIHFDNPCRERSGIRQMAKTRSARMERFILGSGWYGAWINVMYYFTK